MVFSIIRSAFLHTFTTDPDITYTQAYMALWSCLELNFGIICNCLAMLQPFLRAHMPRLADRIMGTSGSHDSPRRGPGDDRSPDDTLVTIGKHNVRRPWLRGDRGTHSYVLHSIDKADAREDGRGGGSGDAIRVTDEFAVDVSRARTGKDDTASERRIMGDSF